MFGLNPSQTYELSQEHFLEACIPMYGRDYICPSLDSKSNSLSATRGERLQTTNLLSIIPTPNYLAQLQTFLTQQMVVKHKQQQIL